MKRLLIAILMTCTITYGQTITWQPTTAWIGVGYAEDTLVRPCPVFQKEIRIRKAIQTATVSVTAHGLYETTINQQRVGTAYFTPGWTAYDTRLQYQVYDVSYLLQKGANTLQVTIGDGWYRGAFGGLMYRNNYGSEAALLYQLEIQYQDGTTEIIGTDSSWQCTTGSILYSDIYGGEIYDARRQPTHWRPVVVKQYAMDNLVPTLALPVQKQETFAPVRVGHTLQGEQVIDFGQNMAGWVQCKVQGEPGDTIQLWHAEVLDKDGNFYTDNLREAKATDSYILKGEGPEVCEPHFTWHGFRYVKVKGCTVKPADWKAIALYSALPAAGSFRCSDTLLNQLQHNIVWSMKSNFLDIPSDCPQRSERLGWGGDAQVFFRAASFNRDVSAFFAKWLQDLQAEQRPDGSVPNIIPNIYRRVPFAGKKGVAGWGDAATIIPWTHFWVYGDTAILRAQYASMKAWVDYIASVSTNHLWTANGYGDWLATGDSTSLPLIDQCFGAWSTQMLVNAATVLDKRADMAYYTQLRQQMKAAFVQHYIQPDGRAVTHTQTAYILALQCGMLPDSLQAKAAAHLAALIRDNQYHLSTGVLGTPYILFVLAAYGYLDIAYTLLHQDTYPSWLYPVKMGATTIWERWDGIKPDGSVMSTSYNHYAYGAVGDWLYRVVAGIDAASPGYKNIIIRPRPGGRLTWAEASYTTSDGKIVSAWKRKGNAIEMQVEIPAGARATIYIPGKDPVQVGSGQYVFEGRWP